MKQRIKRFAFKSAFNARLIFVVYRVFMLLYSSLFLLFRIFPIKDNKIVCCTNDGKGCGGNPKYILSEITRQGLDYEMIWLLKKDASADLPSGIGRVSYNPFSRAYHLSTAKIWIDTQTKNLGTLKRKGQYYIQTWHGSYGLKKIALDGYSKWRLFDTKIFLYNAKIEDVMISNSRRTTSIYRNAFRYEGFVLESGSPCNDLFFKNAAPYREKVAHIYSVTDEHIALYAPTFRDDFRTDCFQMEFDRTRKALQDRFGGKWVMLVRMHPRSNTDAKGLISNLKYIYDATEYPFMHELLAAADVLITDYSSCMFDFAETERPCFLYASDIALYKEDRDFYWDITSLPFPVAQTDEELEEKIRCFDSSVYSEKLSAMFDEVGLCDNGTACRQVVEYIKSLTSN